MANTNWKFLQPKKLSVDPNSPTAENEWKFWLKTFTNFVEAMPAGEGEAQINKLNVLTAYLTAPIYKVIAEETTSDNAVAALRRLYVKPRNEIFARHLLATAQQKVGESIDELVLRLNGLSQNCNFVAVNSQAYSDDMKRDSFISGISSTFVRERLLENQTLSFNQAYEKARALKLAEQTSATYFPHMVNSAQVQANRSAVDSDEPSEPSCSAAAVSRQSKISNKGTFMCYFCGSRNWHRRAKCPARDEKCDYCGKIGHYIKCCMSCKTVTKGCVNSPCLSSLSALRSSFPKHVNANVKINDIVARALIDTGSTNSYLSKSFVDQNHITYTSLRFVANMANTSLKTEIHGICNVKLQFSQHAYEQVEFFIMPDLVSDVIIGDDLLKRRNSMTF